MNRLLAAGADPNARGWFNATPLHYAAENNSNPAIIDALVRAGADPNAKMDSGATPLHDAALANSNPDVIAHLLDAGANPDATDFRGRTPWEVANAASVVNPAIRDTAVVDRLRGSNFQRP